MSYTKVYQACFLSAVDNVDPGSQNTFGRFGEGASVLGYAQRISAHHANSCRVYTFEQLSKAGQTIKSPFDGLF